MGRNVVFRELGGWCKTRPALRADLLRQLYVAKSSKYSSMSAVLRLDLAKNLSLSPAGEFHPSLLVGCGCAGGIRP